MKIQRISKEQYTSSAKRHDIHPLQSWQWGELKSQRWEPVRVGAFDDSSLVSVISILTRKIPFFGGSFGYIPRGILVHDEFVLPEILDALVSFGKTEGLAHLLVDPDVDFQKYCSLPDYTDRISRYYSDAGFVKSGFPIQPRRTVILDVSKSEDTLFSDMRSKHRQYIRKAEKNGITVRLGRSDDIKLFCDLWEDITEERGYVTHSREYYQQVWKLFSETGAATLFIAEHRGSPVGSYMILTNKHNAFEMFGGASRKGRNLKANYLMKWTAIRHFKRKGCKFYDQWGAENLYPGLVQFKEGFSKDVVVYPDQYVFVYDAFRYQGYRLLDFVNRLKQKL